MKILLNGKPELGIREMYTFYKKKTVTPLSYKDYKLVIQDSLLEMMHLILTGESYKLMPRMGAFRIKKTKINYDRLSIDWKTTKDLGQTVYHLNPHSDGFKIKFVWEKKTAILKQDTKRPYSYTLSREWKRELARLMKTPNFHTRYPEEIYNPL